VPFTFLAHQAAVVPLKLARPRWFDGTALALGTIVPDLEYAWQELPAKGWAHTLEGVLLFVLPASLVLAALVRRVVARPLAAHLPDGEWFRLRDYAALAEAPGGAGAWALAVVSVLVGAGTHVVWDAFTHAGTFATTWFPGLEQTIVPIGDLPLRVTGLLQLASSAGGIVATLAALHLIARKRLVLAWAGTPAPLPQATPESRRILLACVLAPALAGAVWGGLDLRTSSVHVFLALAVRAFFRTVVLAFSGLVVGCALARNSMGRNVVCSI
jgi:hypothetical protein